MPYYFLDANGQYYETITEIDTPESHIAVPQRPQPWSEWDGSAWVTGDEPQVPIEDRRATATLDRAAFLLGCVTAGIITEAEAEEAADGSWPSSFNTFLGGMTAVQRIEAKAVWASRADVRRNSDLLALVAENKNVTAEQLDALFGLT